MAQFQLDWYVDVSGYRIEDPQEPEPTKFEDRRATLLDGGGGPLIVPNGGRLNRIDPFKFDGLYRRLAETPKSPEGALGFVRCFGFLHEAKAKDEPLFLTMEAIDSVRALLEVRRKQDWDWLARWLHTAGQDSGLFVHGGVGRIGVILRHDKGMQLPELHFRPGSLLGAIYVQFLMDVTGAVDLRKCRRPGCNEWFKYGPGTKHRDTARYHSAACQKSHAYMKQKESKQ